MMIRGRTSSGGEAGNGDGCVVGCRAAVGRGSGRLSGAQVGVSRQSVHGWLVRVLSEGVGGLADRSSRPHTRQHQMPEQVERVVIELRREHRRWGPKRIRLELTSKAPAWHVEAAVADVEVPSTSTINRILRGTLAIELDEGETHRPPHHHPGP